MTNLVQLNRNIGCIEIHMISLSLKFLEWLNRNIGCIEIIKS